MRRLILLLCLLFPLAVTAQGAHWVWIGDSITDGGWGRSGGSMAPSEERNLKDQNHLYGHSYMFLVAAELQSRYPEREYRCSNRGISGYTLTELEERWERDVEALQPDLLSILVGTNDVDRALRSGGFDLESWERRYRNYLTRTREAFPEVRLVLCTPFVMRAGRLARTENYAERADAVAACAEAVRRLAKEFGAELVDFHALFARLEGQKHVAPEYWVWDGIHPTPAGHHRMARLWLKKVM
ncbi:MAG: SGNH/GDSL hydrolase family protein [Alistipes sp.]|nr:SGNH/GDSL hydrolase family protein [Alistipes sp.]MBQ2843924.1 SGNH/GDSL hydrolase family protein [Alistipes sp.]